MRESRALGLLVVSVGVIAGTGVLFDNSFLTHLATGRLIWSGHGIPRSDPYTFTAGGEPWVVQSWFASVIYGGIDRLAGLQGLRLHFGITTGALAGALWLLTRAARSPLNRLVAVLPVLLMGAFGWAHRPYLYGLLCLAATLLAAEGAIAPRWLLIVGWLWVNTHGSWPYGLVVLALIAVGARGDGTAPSLERRCAAWLAAGFAAAVVNPYGLKLLAFPLVALERREAFATIREWKPPTFDEPDQLAFIAVVAAGIFAIARRPKWRSAVPFTAFVVAALLSSRNLPIAAMVALPGIAAGLAADPQRAPRVPARPIAALAVGLALVGFGSIPTTDDFGDEPYPVAAYAWLASHGVSPTEATIIAQDYVGNWLEGRYGSRARVFVDDRMEVIPLQAVRDHRTLSAGEPGWEEALQRYSPDAVVWERELPLGELLRVSGDWRIVHSDEKFVVALPVRVDAAAPP